MVKNQRIFHQALLLWAALLFGTRIGLRGRGAWERLPPAPNSSPFFIVPYYLLCARGILLTIEIKKRFGNMSTIWAVCKGICLFENQLKPT